MRGSGWVLKALRNFDEFVGVEEYYYFRCKNIYVPLMALF